MTLAIIAAIAHDGSLGLEGVLPWGHIAADMRWFATLTTSLDPFARAERICAYPHLDWREPLPMATPNACIMGRRTYEGLAAQASPHIALPGREIIIISRSMGKAPSPHIASSLQPALDIAKALKAPHTFICGGEEIYAQALAHPALEYLYLSEVARGYPRAEADWPLPVGPDVWSSGEMLDYQQLAYWTRTHTSRWVEEPGNPRVRFGIWERERERQGGMTP